MIETWGSLHMIRTALGIAAALAFLWAKTRAMPPILKRRDDKPGREWFYVLSGQATVG